MSLTSRLRSRIGHSPYASIKWQTSPERQCHLLFSYVGRPKLQRLRVLNLVCEEFMCLAEVA